MAQTMHSARMVERIFFIRVISFENLVFIVTQGR
jgi:hypothetical protein